MNVGKMLQVQQLRCERDTNLVIENLDFSITAGNIVHITGRNGAGKTTLIRTLCGLIRPESGEIRYQGESIFSDLIAYRRQIQYVGHENGLKLELTALENIRLHFQLHCGNDHVMPANALAKLGVDHLTHIPCRYLSEGQRRRVALARLLVCDTPLWLLDEPMSALDRNTQDAFGEVLLEHANTGGCAVMATHQATPGKGPGFQEISLDNS